MNNDHVYPLSTSNQKGENPMTTQVFSTTSLGTIFIEVMSALSRYEKCFRCLTCELI